MPLRGMAPRAGRARRRVTGLSQAGLHAAMPSEPGNAPAPLKQSRDCSAATCTSCAGAKCQRARAAWLLLLVPYKPLDSIARSVRIELSRRARDGSGEPQLPTTHLISRPVSNSAPQRQAPQAELSSVIPRATTKQAGVPPSHAVDAPRVKGSRTPSLAEHNSPIERAAPPSHDGRPGRNRQKWVAPDKTFA